MLVSKLYGGIGNQLFQLWTARKLSIDLDMPLGIDTSFFRNQKHVTERTYALNEVVKQLENCQELNRIQTIRNNLLNSIGYGSIIKESNSGIVPQVDNSEHLTLDGYWQNFRNFDSIKSEIKKKIQNINHSTFLERNMEGDVLAIHVRRGDYVTNYKARNFHGLLTAKYFQIAEKRALENFAIKKIVVFSEDINWCEKNIKFKSNCEYFRQDRNMSDLDVLRLMSRFKNQIISNSSFSWWSAYLGYEENSFVCMPKIWNLKNQTIIENLRLPGWHTIEDSLDGY